MNEIRKCRLINTGLVVKISDFGMSLDIFKSDYYMVRCLVINSIVCLNSSIIIAINIKNLSVKNSV